MNTNLNAAIEYATKYGWAVFPIRAETKRPLTPHGCKDAKKNVSAIKAWWKRWPDASIGIATGSASNLIVIDEDQDEEKGKDGYSSMRLWEADHGDLPDTVRAITGRGGYHLYFHYTGTDFGNRANVLDGVDVRGEGGYVVAPPSVHPNGTEYAWEQGPDEYDIAEVDSVVMQFLHTGTNKSDKADFQLPTTIQSGERNDTLFRLACSLQAQGLPDEAISSSVRAANMTNCVEPLEDTELDLIISSALKYSKGEMRVISNGVGEWHAPQIACKVDKDGNLTDTPAQTIANAEEAIRYDPELFGRIRYNEMAYAVYVYGNVPWKTWRGWREWNNVDDSNLRSYIEHKYGLKSAEKVMDALQNVAAKQSVNPVRDMLKSCQEEWDGNEHVKYLLPSMLGAEQSEYTTAVMRIFMLGAVARIFHPGCKFDYMLVLVGAQGKGKSTFLRFLALNDQWYDDNFSSLDGTRAIEKLRGMWIVEMAELQATKRTKDVETIKSFITSRNDVYREPYGRRTTQRPRTCVLAGTSNPVDFLTDKTGNRRFLPVTCNVHEITFDMFKDEVVTKYEMAQAWGEIMNEYERCGGKPRLVLPKHLQDMAISAQERYTEEDPRIGIIQEWLDTHDVNRVCALMLWEQALDQVVQPTRRDINELHIIMRNNIRGWEFRGVQRCGGKYGNQRAYDRVRKQ